MPPSKTETIARDILPLRASYAPPDEAIAGELLAGATRSVEAEGCVDSRARRLVEAIRARTGGLGGAATKGAVVSMIKSIAVEHARYGVRANSILPGWIATDMTQGAQDNPAFAEKVIPRVPMRRWGEPKDFGGVAVYLTSDASSYHSGDAFVIDGGYSIF